MCLDCEEVHDTQQCPVCASETFAFITRWVPAPERRGHPRAAETEKTEVVDTYRLMLEPERVGSPGWKLMRRGAFGLALFGVAGLMWRRTTPPGQAGGAGADDGAGNETSEEAGRDTLTDKR